MAKRKLKKDADEDPEKDLIDQVKEDLEAAGMQEGRGTAEEQTQRNAQIFMLWLRGVSAHDLAATFGMSVERIYGIIKVRKAEGRRLEKTTFLEVLQDWDLRNETAMSELAKVAASRNASESVKVQAITTRMSREDKRLAVYQAIGVLPEDLGSLAVPISGMKLAAELLDILESHGVLTEEILRDIADRYGAPDEIDGDASELEPLEA